MSTLIVKRSASGDVVRTTAVLNRLIGEVVWVTDRTNLELIAGTGDGPTCLPWEERERCLDKRYELVINLEDEVDTARFLKAVNRDRTFGASLDADGHVVYTEDSAAWFDMSLISRHGRVRADELKLRNRRTYQDLIFAGLGWTFEGETYRLPAPTSTGLSGDVAIAPVAGPVWPMKGWVHYQDLKRSLESDGYTVNVLPRRQTLREHLADIRGHNCLVSGDSLPMHLALGLGVPCITLFNCTSPWEIHDYRIQTKIVSPLLEQYFYRRGSDPAAMSAIRLSDVYDAVVRTLAAKPTTVQASDRL